MDDKRKGEIALKVVAYLLMKKGANLAEGILRQLGDTAKAMDIEPDELKEFARLMLHDHIDALLKPKAAN